MTIDKEKLKILAEAAVPGPWQCREAEGSSAVCWADGWVADSCTEQDIADNRYIAAASPSTVLALLAEIERLERRNSNQQESIRQYQDHMEGGESILSLTNERDQLKAENELMRALIGDAATDLRKASAWVCREVEAGTRSATHWAVRLRERADRLDAAMAKEASHG